MGLGEKVVERWRIRGGGGGGLRHFCFVETCNFNVIIISLDLKSLRTWLGAL